MYVITFFRVVNKTFIYLICSVLFIKTGRFNLLNKNSKFLFSAPLYVQMVSSFELKHKISVSCFTVLPIEALPKSGK